MIHQLIFAGPKPGLSAAAFQSYWVNFHAIDYAAKIPQIKQYLVATRLPVPYPREVPFFEGVAEIWLNNEEEQIASLQTPQFLQGARTDEPRWAAFWRTFVQDSDSVVTREGPDFANGAVKFYVFLKRIPSATLEEFKQRIVTTHASVVSSLPGVERCLAAFARSGLYGFGEPRFDALEIWGFPDSELLISALSSPEMRLVEESWRKLVTAEALFTFAAQTNWIIAPGERC